MNKDMNIAPSGLFTAPAVVTAPEGALQDAEEIVIRLPGKAEPRPGFASDETFDHAVIGVQRLLVRESADGSAATGSDLIAVGSKAGGGAGTYVTQHAHLGSSATTITNGQASPADLTWNEDKICGVSQRGNMYVTCKDRVRKINSTDIASPAGLHPPHLYIAVSSIGGSTYYSAVYKACLRWTDPSGVIVRSGVSGPAVLVSPTPASTVAITAITGYGESPNEVPSEAVVEIYRSEVQTGTDATVFPPPDAYYFRGEVPVSTVTSVTFTDDILTARDNTFGAGLYTNDDQEGAEGNHAIIPTAGCAAAFNGSLFIADLTFPAELELTYDLQYGESTGISTGIGYRKVTGTYTNGSPTISSISTSLTGLKVGMILAGNLVPGSLSVGGFEFAGTGFAVITAIGASSITLDRNYTGTTGSKSRWALDSIRIGNNYYPAGIGPLAPLSAAPYQGYGFLAAAVRAFDPLQIGGSGGVDSSGAIGVNTTGISADVINVIAHTNVDFSDTPSGFLSGIVAIRGLTAPQGSPDSFTIYATHGSEYSPALPEPTTSAKTVTGDYQPNGIAWSNNQEPEHFTGANIDRIAPVGRVMCMESLNNGLLVFLNLALWRVAGSGAESGFRFDQHDHEFRLLYPRATTRFGDLVYAWGHRGICSVDENNVTPISQAALGDRLGPIERKVGAGSTSARGMWGAVNRGTGEVLFSAPAVSDLAVGERLYVFNTQTGAWTNWFLGAALHSAVYGKNISGLDVLFVQDGINLRTERLVNDGYVYAADALFAGNCSVTGATMHITSGTWSPTVGDLVLDVGANPFLVISVTDSTHVTLDSSGYSGGTYKAYIAYTSKITPIAHTAKAPGVLKKWGEANIWWGSLLGMCSYAISCTSSLSGTAVSQTRTISDSRIANDRAEAVRFTVPRNHARCTRLYPSVSIRQGGATWRFEGLGIKYDFMSDRTARRR